MEIEIYLDSLFFMNLAINLWILQLLKYKFVLEGRELRIWISAASGAGVYIFSFLLPGRSWLIQPVSLVVSIPWMICLVLPKRKRRYFFRMVGWGLVYSFIIAGVLRAVLYKWQIFAGQEITAATVMVGAYICVRIGAWCIKKGKASEKRNIYKVVISSAGDKTILKALLDTGNSLVEPISKKPVCIMEEEFLAHITLENPLFLRAIPYRSVGCEQGTLYGVEIPELKIFCENTCYTAKNVICAGAPHKLSTKGMYQMILHPALLNEENKEEVEENDYDIGERNEKNDIHACGQGLV